MKKQKQINNVNLIKNTRQNENKKKKKKKIDRFLDLDEKLTSKHSKFHYANERD
jgi:hypothetical protein